MKTLTLAALVAATIAAAPARAEFVSGNQLYGDLNSDDISPKIYALGYIIGVADTVVGIAYCPASRVTAGQLKDIVQAYLCDTPAERHRSGDVLVLRALSSVFPCKRQQQQPAPGI